MNKKVILIFGGDGKIAQAIVQKYLSEENYIVIAIDKNPSNRNTAFRNNPNYHYYSADVTDINNLMDLYKTITQKFSYATHIISMAGGPISSELNGLLEATFEDINKSILLNLNSHIYITKIFLPLIHKCTSNNRSITLVSSVNAIKSFDLPAYSAGKAGILGFINSIVRELGKNHIRINAITPGTVATKKEIEEKYVNYKYKDMMALTDRFTSPEDIADACFSLTEITKAITGQNIIVDSGQIV